ncbi:MAG: selenium metabolism-associated LysR family transcriptional regulator [Candidatus Geothermincolia bacterium]
MNINNLQTFIEIVRAGSFSGAARRLGLSQPGVSFQIRALEREFGAQLLERRGKTIELTDAGKVLYDQALELVESAAKLRDAMDETSTEVRGTVHAAASTIPGEFILPRLASEFRKRHPFVQMIVEISDSRTAMEQTAAGTVDVAFCGAPAEMPQLESRPFYSDRLVMIAPPDHPLRGKSAALDDLREMDLVMREEGSGTRRTILRSLAEGGLALADLHIALELGSTTAVINAVAAGAGVSLVSRWALDCPLSMGLVAEIPLAGIDLSRRFYYITRRRALPRQVRAFLELLENEPAT